MHVTALADTTAYCLTFGSPPVPTPVRRGEPLLFDVVRVRNDHFTVVQSGLNQYVLATADFTEPPRGA